MEDSLYNRVKYDRFLALYQNKKEPLSPGIKMKSQIYFTLCFCFLVLLNILLICSNIFSVHFVFFNRSYAKVRKAYRISYRLGECGRMVYNLMYKPIYIVCCSLVLNVTKRSFKLSEFRCWKHLLKFIRLPWDLRLCNFRRWNIHDVDVWRSNDVYLSIVVSLHLRG